MPALTADSAALKPPFAPGRCAWTRPELQSHGLLILSRGQMLLLDSLPAHFDESMDDPDLFETLGPTVPLESIQYAKHDLLQNTIGIELTSGRLELRFSDARAADTCFTQLWRRLAPRLTLHTPVAGRWAQARLPLTVLGAILAIVSGLAISISVLDGMPATDGAASVNIPGRPVAIPAFVHALIGWMDVRVVCGLGGAAAAVAQMWLLRRITQPPVAMELICDRD